MEEDSESIIPTVCWGGGGECMAGCGILLHVKNGRLVKVTGDPECPFNQGAVCSKPLAFPQVVYHPQPAPKISAAGHGCAATS